jgi:hypothetical protein
MRALYVHVYAVIRDCTCLFVGVWVYVCGCVYVCRCVSVSNNAFLSLSQCVYLGGEGSSHVASEDHHLFDEAACR